MIRNLSQEILTLFQLDKKNLLEKNRTKTVNVFS